MGDLPSLFAFASNERVDLTWVGKDHIGTIAHHSGADQSRGVPFGTVVTRIRF
jgi:hypothetical protein